jgi:hypothetical protein
MNFFVNLGQNIVLPLIALWDVFINALPGILGGLLIVIFGYLLGGLVEHIVIKVLKNIRFEKFIHSFDISNHFKKFDISHFLGVLLKWYIFVIFLVPAASMARLGALSLLLLDFAKWFPDFLLAITIIVFGWIGADVLDGKIQATKIHSKEIAGMVVKTIIFLFISVIALSQIGVNIILLQQTFIIILSAIALGFALAVGIGFGLGMKDDAKQIVRKLRKKI